MTARSTVPGPDLATRARDAARKADAAAWSLHLRAWREPSTADDAVLGAFQQTSMYLGLTADALEPSDISSVPDVALRSSVVTSAAMLTGTTVLGLTLSGLTMAVAVAGSVMLAVTLGALYQRWAARRVPRRLDGPGPDVAVVAAEVAADVIALCDDLEPDLHPRRVAAQEPLGNAAEWALWTIRALAK